MSVKHPMISAIQQGWWQLAAWQKATLVVAGMGLVAALLWFGSAQHQTLVSLLAGRELRVDEIQRIQFVLGKAGFREFRVRETGIDVPADQLALCLQTLADQDAIPADLMNEPDERPEINMFMSRHQQELQLQLSKKKQIRDMVSKFPFVQQVWVQFDASNPAGPFENRKYSCVVSVRPRDATPLVPEQIHSIRQVALGTVAGLEAKDIVVADVGSGIALSGVTTPASIDEAVSETQNRLHANNVLENAIRDSLSDLRGVTISVEHILPLTSGADDSSSPIPASGMVRDDVPAGELPAIPVLAGTNGHASVPASKASLVVDPNSSTPRKDVTNTSMIDRQRAWSGPSQSNPLAIRVTVPNGLLQQQLAEQYGQQIPQEALQLKFDELKQAIQSRVAQVLDASRFPADQAQLNVVMLPVPDSSAPWWRQLPIGQRLTGQQGGAIVAIGSGLVLCLILSYSASRRGRKLSQTETVIDEDVPELHDIRKQIDRLIEKDPEVVAQVLQDWIRKAG